MVGNQARVNKVTHDLMNKAAESRELQQSALEARIILNELISIDRDIRLAKSASTVTHILQHLKNRSLDANVAYDSAISLAALEEDRQFLTSAKAAFNNYVAATQLIAAIQFEIIEFRRGQTTEYAGWLKTFNELINSAAVATARNRGALENDLQQANSEFMRAGLMSWIRFVRNDENELRQIFDALSTASLLLEESRGMVQEPVARAAIDELIAQAARGAMSQIGPAVVFPLGVPGNVRGVLTVGRRHGAPPFPQAQADVVASFAAQAGVALELAASRAEAERLSLYEDRDRIARDLHDLVIQRLYATGMSLEGTMPMITRPEVASRITHAVDAMDETIKEIRSTIFQLQARGTPSRPDLRGEILALADEMTDMLGFAPSLRLGSGLGEDISPEVADQVLAALREALSNAARHANASQVDVTVDTGSDGMLTVQVTDNGTGIPEGGRRSGLRNLASRAEKLGGELRLEPADPDAATPGTRLEWRVPR
jgi:signal transduction histidine kinase